MQLFVGPCADSGMKRTVSARFGMAAFNTPIQP
jgi:hypothetical protein